MIAGLNFTIQTLYPTNCKFVLIRRK